MSALAVLATALAVYLAVSSHRGALGPLQRVRPTRGNQFRDWLAQSGIAVGPSRFLLMSLGCGVTAFGAVLAVTATPVVALVPGLTAACVPATVVARRRDQRLGAVRAAWPDALRELSAAVGAGLSLTQAMAELGRTGPAPIRAAFRTYPALAHALGTPVALETVKRTLADPTTDRVVEVLLLAHERGGPIVVEVLADLAESTTEDLRTAEVVRTEALEQRINARAVFALPWLVLAVLTARPGPFRDFYRSAGGLTVTALGAIASLGGLALVTRLARIPVEPRVFGEPR